LPIWLYRAHLGWLLGKRFLMLTHIGRKSGQLRQVVLEVVAHDEDTGAYFVAAGWRGHADWFLNIQANSAVQVNIGRQVFKATAEVVQIIDAVAVFYVYARRYPFAFQELTQLMMNELLQPDQKDCFRLAESVPLVKLTPTHPVDKETS
jgi:deazaflavin-dependent oxidoreductase (nitroreductase family)